MARPIKLTETQLKKAIKEVRAVLTAGKSISDMKKITINLDAIDMKDKKAFISFTDAAYYKMKFLIDQCNKEIGWHGVVHRDETKANVFIVSDILVFPQTVTGTTVTPDADEYYKWLFDEDKKDVFNHIRFHGHSHVNMATSPSGVDTNYQDDLLQNVTDFYIFGIFNKRDVNTLVIYDVENNICYEDKDITICTSEGDYKDWACDMIEKYVKELTVTPAQTNSLSGYYAGKEWDPVTHTWVEKSAATTKSKTVPKRGPGRPPKKTQNKKETTHTEEEEEFYAQMMMRQMGYDDYGNGSLGGYSL